MTVETPPERESARPAKEPLKDDIYTHIASQSATKVGVCLTLLGIFRVVEGLKKIDTFGDELLAFGALAFLVTGVLAYFALKTKQPQVKYTVGKIADALFLASHGLLIVICLIIAYELV